MVVWHACVMFCPDWAYLTQFRGKNITRMTIFGLSAAILDSGSHLVSLEIIQIIIISYLLVVWHTCVMFCPDWAYLAQFRSQNITRMTIFGLSAAIFDSGGHLVYWKSSKSLFHLIYWVVWHVCMMFCPNRAYLALFRSQNITWNGILAYRRPFWILAAILFFWKTSKSVEDAISFVRPHVCVKFRTNRGCIIPVTSLNVPKLIFFIHFIRRFWRLIYREICLAK